MISCSADPLVWEVAAICFGLIVGIGAVTHFIWFITSTGPYKRFKR